MSLNAGSIVAALELDTGNFSQKLLKAKSEADGIGSKLKGYGDGLESLGKGLTLGITAPVAALGAGIVKTSMDFESGMSKVKAISGASAEDMVKLSDKAKEMGSTTKFSATESSEALSYMAMAGWKTNEMLDGLPGVMNLAAASGEDLATVSDIVTDALSAFGLQASDSGHFADVLATASSNANTNVSMLGESFKYVAPVAGAMNYSIEDTSLVLGLMANAGIKASQAGTSLRGALLRLANDSGAQKAMNELGVEFYNLDGTARPLRGVIDDLRESFKNLTPEQQSAYAEALFGKEAIAGMLAVLGSSDADFNKFSNALDNAEGSAKKMAETMEDNVKGQLTLLKSNVEGVALQLGEVLLPIVNDGVTKLNNLVTSFSKLNPETQKTIVEVAGLAAAAGPLLIVGGKTAKGIGSIIDLFGKFAPATVVASGKVAGLATQGAAASTALAGGGGLLSSLGATATAIAPWAAGITAAGVALYGLAKYLKSTGVEIDLFGDEVSESTQKAVQGFLDLERDATSSLELIRASGMEVTGQMAEEISNNVNTMKEQVINSYNEQEQEALNSLTQMLNNTTQYTEEEKQIMIENARQGFEEKRNTAEEGSQMISEILQQAAQKHRTLTEQEWTEINTIMSNLQQQGIEVLTSTQAEQESILQQMKEQGTQLTTEMASEMIAKSSELKEQTVKNAEEQYKKSVDAIKNMKTDGSKEAEEMKNNLIKQAEEQKNQTIQKAEEMHKRVVEQGKAQAKNLASALSSEDGHIMSKWEQLKSWFAANPIYRFIKTQDDGGMPGRSLPSKKTYKQINQRGYAAGTNFSSGGYSLVGEHGPEMVFLPKGSRVLNNSETNRVAKGVTIHNHYNMPNLIIREEADIDKLSTQLERKQQRDLRARGLSLT
ncbi:MAG: phage tail tape measure protein [Peptoniphilaceae bacterium]